KRYDVLVHALPLFHQHGLGGFHATLIAGSSLHLLPRFDPEELLRAAEKATVLFAVPTMYQRLEGTAESNRLRLCVSGSAPPGRAVAAHAEGVLGRAPLVRYGTTASGLDTSQAISDPPADTVGIPLAGGEQVTAWVVMKPGAAFDPDKLSEHAGTMLAPFKRPKEIKRLEALPRNHVGKIDRRRLR